MAYKHFVHVDIEDKVELQQKNSISTDTTIVFGENAEILVSDKKLRELYEILKVRYEENN